MALPSLAQMQDAGNWFEDVKTSGDYTSVPLPKYNPEQVALGALGYYKGRILPSAIRAGVSDAELLRQGRLALLQQLHPDEALQYPSQAYFEALDGDIQNALQWASQGGAPVFRGLGAAAGRTYEQSYAAAVGPAVAGGAAIIPAAVVPFNDAGLLVAADGDADSTMFWTTAAYVDDQAGGYYFLYTRNGTAAAVGTVEVARVHVDSGQNATLVDQGPASLKGTQLNTTASNQTAIACLVQSLPGQIATSIAAGNAATTGSNATKTAPASTTAPAASKSPISTPSGAGGVAANSQPAGGAPAQYPSAPSALPQILLGLGLLGAAIYSTKKKPASSSPSKPASASTEPKPSGTN